MRRLVLITIVLAACSTPVVSRPSPSPSDAVTGAPTPGAMTPSEPAPAQPSPRSWSARTPAEILSNLPGDQNFPSAIGGLSSGVEPDPRAVGRTPSLGTPIYVRGLRPGDANEYIVPVQVGDITIALMKIGVDATGLGRLDAMRGWSMTPSFPTTTEAAAIARGSATGDPVIKAEFVWTYIRGSADELQPFWLLTRRSGAAFLLLENGALVSASEYGP
jgi:hypothetical protein